MASLQKGTVKGTDLKFTVSLDRCRLGKRGPGQLWENLFIAQTVKMQRFGCLPELGLDQPAIDGTAEITVMIVMIMGNQDVIQIFQVN